MNKVRPCLILSTLIFLVYGNTFLNSFHFDDLFSILQKPWIRGLDNIPQFIFSWKHRPLVILSFNLNYAISEFQVWSYHSVNIVGHIGVSLLVYQLVLLMGEMLMRFHRVSIYRPTAFFAALIFALHPLNTESVTYISSRSSLFATFFYLLSLILLFRGFLARHPLRDEKPKTGTLNFFGSAFALLLGGLSKEIIFTWPVLAFLFHYVFISRAPLLKWLSDNLKLILPVLALLLWPIGLGIIVFSGGKFFQATGENYSPAVYLLTQTQVIPFEYFWKMFFPFNLSIDINFPYVSDWTRITNHVGIAVLIVYSAFFLTCRDPLISFGMAWALLTVLPTSSFVPLLDLAVEHRTYLPLVGFAIFSGALLCRLMEYSRARFPSSLPLWGKGRIAVLAGIILIPLLFSAATIQRNKVWKDEVTLWSDARDKAPRLLRPYNNIGQAYDKQQLYDEAISQFEKALYLNPNYFFALNNLGNVYGKLGNYGKAIPFFRRALAVKLDYAPANYNLAKALHLGGKTEEALHYYREAVINNPVFEEALFNLAHLESQLGLFPESVKTYLRFIEINPKHVKAHFGLANAYSKNLEYENAVSTYQQTIRLDPTNLFLKINLATTYVQMGKLDDALTAYEKILTLKPDLAGVHKNLGLIYAQDKNHPEKGAYHFEKSLALDPKQPQAEAMRKALAFLQAKFQK